MARIAFAIAASLLSIASVSAAQLGAPRHRHATFWFELAARSLSG